MTHLTVKVKKWGELFWDYYPQKALDDLGISVGEVLDVEIVKKRRRNGFGICRGASPYKEEEEPHDNLW